MTGACDGTLWRALEEAAAARDGSPAIESADGTVTLDDVLAESRAIAERLRADLGGGPVLYVPRNSARSVAFIVAAMTAGAAPLLADPAWTQHELADAARRCGARAIVRDGCDLQRSTVVDDPAWVAPTAGVAVGRFTSGTAGAPRCLAFGESAVIAAARGWGVAAGYGADDRVLCLATLNNGLAFNASLFAVLLSGACLCFHSGPLVRSAVMRTIARRRPTVLVAFPFVYDQLVTAAGAGAALSSLRLAVSSAAPLSPETKCAWAAVANRPVCDYYGLAEVGPCTFSDGAIPASVGMPLAGVTIRVTSDDGTSLPPGEEGRIRVRTPSMATEFADRDPSRLRGSIDDDGFFVTQDRGRMSESGALFLTGRLGRQLNIAGRKIEPREVEAVIGELPRVRGAVVCARPRGKRVSLVAYVEGDGLTAADVVAHCRTRLAPYKVPERVGVLDRLPRSSTGKVALGRLESLEPPKES